jgi:alkylated DNA nucleotide flippase Atl1
VATVFLEPLPEKERYSTWRLVRRDGSLAGRGAGVVDLLGTMRLTRSAGRVLARVPDEALDRAYEVVAGRRSLLGRLVPDGPAPRRFP